jgi:hypothetical protein
MAKAPPKKTWAELKNMDFTDLVPDKATYKAINLVRQFPKEIAPDMNSSDFFAKVSVPELVLGGHSVGVGTIVWDDVVFTLQSVNAPALPIKVTPIIPDPEDNDALYPYSVDTTNNWLTLNKSKKTTSMLLVVSRCFHERANVICDRLLQEESDWWIKLAINDAHLGMAHLHIWAKLPSSKWNLSYLG